MDTANAVSVQPTQWSHSANDACWLDSLFLLPRRDARHNQLVHTVFASRREHLEEAEDLVRRRYAWRGYKTSSAVSVAWPDGPRVTLLAKGGDRLLGTLTVRPGPAQGLLAEQSYATEIDALRKDGRRLGELVKLAIEEGADWRTAMDVLVQAAYVVTRFVHGLSDVLIEVNPRHTRFYERVFGFVVEGAERFCTRVCAPSVLMRLELEQFGRRLEHLKI